MRICEEVREAGHWDVIVCGGGVAGVAAALAAKRAGKKTLIIEKTLSFGGLATIGLVNYFVPMCNGRGKQIIFGMAEEFLRLSYEVSWTSVDDSWKNDLPEKKGRLQGNYSPTMFALALAELLKKEGVDIYLDTILSGVDAVGGHIKGIIVDSKSGREYMTAEMFVDCTGDADLLYRAGVPTVTGENFFTYYAFGMNFETMQKALDAGNIRHAYRWYMGGRANLYGGGHPEGRKKYAGVTKEDVTEYVLENQSILFDNVKDLDKNKFDLTYLPEMAQFRTTRHIAGDYTFTHDDAYKHFDDSVCAINSFDRNDYLYEVRFGTLVKTGYDNVITAGRSASADGYGWDILRVIPPAILTGQAAGNACALAIDDKKPIYGIDVAKLQRTLFRQNVMIHFPDELVPDKITDERGEDNGHI